jgi:hypothetical protein
MEKVETPWLKKYRNSYGTSSWILDLWVCSSHLKKRWKIPNEKRIKVEASTERTADSIEMMFCIKGNEVLWGHSRCGKPKGLLFVAGKSMIRPLLPKDGSPMPLYIKVYYEE